MWYLLIACMIGVCQDAGEWSFESVSNEWSFTVRQQPAVEKPGVVAPVRRQEGLPAAPPEYDVVMYGAAWCGPCQAWKRNELPKLERAGVSVVLKDCDVEPQWKSARWVKNSVTGQRVLIPGVRSYPTIAIVRRSDQIPVAQFVGPVSAQELQKRIPKPTPANAANLMFRWNIEGNWSPTQKETAAHLMQRHKIDVTNMSHQQMLAIHDALHDKAN